MTRMISESDWKVFRDLHSIALERFCKRAVAEIERAACEANRTSLDRYRAVCDALKRRDKELAAAFDEFRRSTAWQQLAIIQSHKLLTDAEIMRFSSETREVLRVFLGT